VAIAQATWAHGYKSVQFPGFNIANDAALLSNGDLLVAGFHPIDAQAYDLWVMRISPSGAPIWTRTLGGEFDDEARSIVPMEDGGAVIAGSSYSFEGPTPKQGGWLVRLGSDGTVLWQRKFDVVPSDRSLVFHSIRRTPDGGFIVAGTADTDATLLKLDSSGGLQWMKRYQQLDQSSYRGSEFRSVQITSDGGYVAAGSIRQAQSGAPFVVKTGAGGDVQWQSVPDALTPESTCTGVIENPPGHLYVVGYRTVEHSNQRLFVASLTLAGVPMWERLYGEASSSVGLAIDGTPEGDCIVAGSIEQTATGQDYWALRLDESGSIVWQHRYVQDQGSGPLSDEARVIRGLGDGTFLLGGHYFSIDGLLLRLDAGGSLSSPCGLLAETSATVQEVPFGTVASPSIVQSVVPSVFPTNARCSPSR
jgi:hypothetical protein